MMRQKVISVLTQTLQSWFQSQALSFDSSIAIEVQKPNLKEHGDLSTNLALILASQLKQKPRPLAEALLKVLQGQTALFSKIEIAGPGFINFTFSPQAYAEGLEQILKQSEKFGRLELGCGKRILLEYVSANPTGPMHVGHGRNAVVGNVLARLLQHCGYEVTQEFYINDHGVQIRTLGNSILYSIQKRLNPSQALEAPPEGSYQGSYLEELVDAHWDDWKPLVTKQVNADQLIQVLGKQAGKILLQKIKEDLKLIHIEFDRFFPESSLYEESKIPVVLDQLREKNVLFEEGGATWFRSTDFGDDKDRVLVKQDGAYTYFTPDIAYHHEKYSHGFDGYINVWGADHAGYIPRVRAAMQALGNDPQKLQVVFIQMVNLKRGAERVQMSKRSGTYVTLREIIDEVGPDATRFFFVQRSANAQLDFDLELAKSQSADNPVYYLQYAHARIASIFKKAAIDFTLEDLLLQLHHLTLPEEFELIAKLHEYPEVLTVAAHHSEPHRVAFYLLELAQQFQAYYSRAKQDAQYKVITDNREQTLAKLALLQGIQIVFKNGFAILGISAPEWMEQDISYGER